MTSLPDSGVPYLDSTSARPFAADQHDADKAGFTTWLRTRQHAQAIPVALGFVLVVGFLFRFAAADRLSPHADEASSILAAHAVASHGVPVLPSGTVYFQGATLSYLLAPFVWLGVGELDDLAVMRLLLVLAGVSTVFLSFRLAHFVTGDARISVAMALLVAIDPVSVQWSGHVRMYGLLQAITVGLAWAFIRQLVHAPSWKASATIVALFWAAVFTHAGAALLWPAMVIAAVIIHRQRLLNQPHVVATLLLSAIAPVALVGLNQLLGTASVGARSASSIPALTFVGDNLIEPLARLRMPLTDWDWGNLLSAPTLSWLVPGLIVAIATIVAGGSLAFRDTSTMTTVTTRATITLLSLYWMPVIAVAVFTISPKERYLLHVHLLGYLFVAILVVRLVDSCRSPARNWKRIVQTIGTGGVIATVVFSLVAAVVWRLHSPVLQPDYNAALDYVVERRQPGELVVVALPAVGYLSLDQDSRDDLYYLAGPQERPRAQRFTVQSRDGHLVDYWAGTDSLVSAAELSRFLAEHPDSWIIVDRGRMRAEWGPAGIPMTNVINSMTFPAFEAPGGALVLRPGAVASAANDIAGTSSDLAGSGPAYGPKP